MAELPIRSDGAGGSLLDCLIQPRSSRCAVAGLHDGRLKIALTSPPVDGKANEALRKFAAAKFNLPPSCVELSSGLASRRKTLHLKGLPPEEASRKIKDSLERNSKK